MTKYTKDSTQIELPFTKLCECGCNNPAPIAKHSDSKSGVIKGQPLRFISGHNSRLRAWEYVPDLTKAIQLCACGCGNPAPIALRDNHKLGHVRGESVRFIRGHHNKVRVIRPVSERFWEKVDKREHDECWDWTGCKDKHGYGYLSVGDHRTERAYRVSYELHYGPIPDGMDICHKCDHPPCCNPKHLFAGTAKDNHDDMVAKGRDSKPPVNAMFTNAQVREFRRQFAQMGVSVTAFATFHDVPINNMWNILRRNTYKNA